MTALALALLASLAAQRPPAPPTDLPPPASAGELRERIELGLGRIHGEPSPAFWRSLGPDGAEALERIARDGSELPRRRARALSGLSHLGGERAAAALRQLSGDEGLPFSVRAAAMVGAGRVLPPAEVAEALTPALGSRRGVDRTVAAEVLAERAPAESCGAIRARAGREKGGGRASWARALSRCGAAGR